MINVDQAEAIDLLRKAAKHHEEVSNLLLFLGRTFSLFDEGNPEFTGDGGDRQYFSAVLSASAFIKLDRGE